MGTTIVDPRVGRELKIKGPPGRKILATSDWHIDHKTLGVARRAEIERAIDRTVVVAMEAKVDLYLFLGDLADPSDRGGTYHAIQKALDVATHLGRVGIRSVWMTGNHDVCDDGSGASTLEPLKQLVTHGIDAHVIDAPELFSVRSQNDDGCFVLALPFTAVARAYDPETRVKALADEAGRRNPNAKVIVASHLSIPDMHPGSETTDMPRGREIMLPMEATAAGDLRLSGHYHHRQTILPAGGGSPIYVIGSLARLTFGEEGNEPGFQVYEIEAPPG